jgi:cobalt-zinc-cadmium efflux system protein
VHHVHIWPLSTTETALTAHMVQPSGAADELIRAAQHMLHHRFHIEHCTLQIERGHAGAGNCETEDC